jgi:23S rRNA (cytosine1962-C5)-methyltransferase
MSVDYELLDSGMGRKLERFGNVILARPCAQAIWQPALKEVEWRKCIASFSREGSLQWKGREKLPESWVVQIDEVKFKLSSTDFGHLGVFPEQRAQWKEIARLSRAFQKERKAQVKVLNLFAYSGGSSLAAAHAGAEVCHVDAAKGMVDWARQNAQINGLEAAPIRWIVDDVNKFLQRELKRQKKYDMILLDPPSYGRGAKGEVFKIQEHLPELLKNVVAVLSEKPVGVLLSCHTPECTPLVLQHMLSQALGERKGNFRSGEMLLEGQEKVLGVPSGNFCWWLNQS